MVEIAISFAAVGERPKLVILRAPTSSLDAGRTAQLRAYIRRFTSEGGSVLLISHILGEILSTCDRIVVMKDGGVVADRAASRFDTRSLMEAMGSVVREQGWARRAVEKAGEPVLAMPPRGGHGLAFKIRRGSCRGNVSQ